MVTRRGRVVLRVLLAIVLLVGVAAAWAYVQASRVPDEYAPADLSARDRRAMARDFWSESVVGFNNAAQKVEPFTWEVQAAELNRYLASIDEIAAENPHRRIKPGEINRMMAKAGLSEPAAAFGDGVLTLMVRSTDYSKVLSVDLAVKEGLQIRTVGTRVGRLDLPGAVGLAALAKLKDVIRARGADDSDDVLAELILSVNDVPMRDRWTVDDKDIRITGVRITAEGLAVSVEPIGRGTGPVTAVSTDYPPGFDPDSE